VSTPKVSHQQILIDSPCSTLDHLCALMEIVEWFSINHDYCTFMLQVCKKKFKIVQCITIDTEERIHNVSTWLYTKVDSTIKKLDNSNPFVTSVLPLTLCLPGNHGPTQLVHLEFVNAYLIKIFGVQYYNYN
jgi:hypothetical protein